MKDPEPQPYPDSPRSTTAARRNGYLLPTVDDPDTDIKAKVWRNIQPEGVQMPSLPPVGVKLCPAEEGGAKVQVNHPPVLALDSNTTDPLPSCTQDENMVADKTQPGNQERRVHKFPATRLPQDRPNPFSRPHQDTAGALSMEPTSSPAQFIKGLPTPGSLPNLGTAGAPSLEPASSPAQAIKLDKSREQ